MEATGAPIRVLHVMPHLIHGGTEQYILRQVSALDAGAIDARVAYLSPREDLEAQYRAAGIPVTCLGHRRLADAPRTLARLVGLVTTQHIDVVHTHSRYDRLYGQTAALLTGRPVVDTLHSLYTAEGYLDTRQTVSPLSLKGLRLRGEDQLAARTVKHRIAVSEAMAIVYRDRANTVDPPVSVVPPFTDFVRYAPGAPEAGRIDDNLSGRSPVLLHVGRLVPVKAQHVLVDAVAELVADWPDMLLLIAGDGPLRNELGARIAALGLDDHVRLLGSRGDVPALLASCDLFVLSSESEGHPIVVVEAVAAGKPVVSRDLGPVRDLVVDGVNGRLVAEDNAFAAAVDDVLRRLPTYGRHAESARQRLAGAYSSDPTAVLEPVYRRALAARRRTPGSRRVERTVRGTGGRSPAC